MLGPSFYSFYRGGNCDLESDFGNSILIFMERNFQKKKLRNYYLQGF